MRSKEVHLQVCRGLTLLEVIVVLAIFAILCGIGSYFLVNARRATGQNTITDTLALTLEQARANALSGKSGKNSGVKFASTSYTLWSGDTFDSSNTSNQVHEIGSNYELSRIFSGGADNITFSRLNGIPQATGTVKILSSYDSARIQSVIIGDQGDITVVK